MGAVGFVTEFGNTINPSEVISDLMAPPFVKKVVAPNLISVEDLPIRTQTKKHVKDAALSGTLSAIAEANPVALAAAGEYSQTSVTSTIAKIAIASGLSIEQLQFGTQDAATMAEKQANLLARAVDDDFLSLFGGLSQNVTAASVLTVEDLYACQYAIFAAECPNQEMDLSVVLNHKGLLNLKKEQINSGASAYTNPQYLSILQGKPQANRFVGTIPGFQIYSTSGHTTSGGDNVQAVFHSLWCFAGSFAPAPQVWVNNKGVEGLYQEIVSWFFYDIVEWNDAAGVGLNSDA